MSETPDPKPLSEVLGGHSGFLPCHMRSRHVETRHHALVDCPYYDGLEDEPPGPTLRERAQTAQDRLGWANMPDAAEPHEGDTEFSEAAVDVARVVTDLAREVESLRREVESLRALNTPIGGAQHPQNAGGVIPGHGQSVVVDHGPGRAFTAACVCGRDRPCGGPHDCARM